MNVTDAYNPENKDYKRNQVTTWTDLIKLTNFEIFAFEGQFFPNLVIQEWNVTFVFWYSLVVCLQVTKVCTGSVAKKLENFVFVQLQIDGSGGCRGC